MINFASQELRDFYNFVKGLCKTCGKESTLCEHGQCRDCKCVELCWLD